MALRRGILGAALASWLAACGTAGVSPGPTESASGLPGTPAAGTGTANLNWTPVTQNTDGSELTDLAGYNVHYGISQHALTNVQQVASPGATSAVVSGLGSGTWYFGVAAYTSDGTEGNLSNIRLKTIP